METAPRIADYAPRIGTALNLGIYWGWMSLAFFSASLAGPGGTELVEAANLIALTVSTIVVVALALMPAPLAPAIASSRLLQVATTVAGALGTLAVLGAASLGPLLVIGSLCIGVPEGLLLYLFVRRAVGVCHSTEEIIVLFSWALLIASGLYLAVVFAGTASGILTALLPLLSLISPVVFRSSRPAQPAEDRVGVTDSATPTPPKTPRDDASLWESSRKLPWKLLLGLAVFGMAFGLMRISTTAESLEVFQTSYLAHTLARAATAVLALVLVGRMKKAYWVLSTIQLLAFTLGICSYWMPLESTAILTIAATTAGYTCLELLLWAVLYELFTETRMAFNILYGVIRGLVSLTTLLATAFALFVLGSMAPDAIHVVLLFFLLAMILVSSLLFGSRDVASLWGLQRPALTADGSDATQTAQVLADRFGLTARESEVLALLVRGRNEPFISEALFISPSTTHSHVTHIYAKLGVHSRQELLDVVERLD